MKCLRGIGYFSLKIYDVNYEVLKGIVTIRLIYDTGYTRTRSLFSNLCKQKK